MSGRHRADDGSVPRGFHSTGRAKIACDICGADGYPDGPWMEKHRGPHDFRCRCGRRFTGMQGLAGHARLDGHEAVPA